MQESKLPGPGIRDWLLLAIGVVFVAMGLIILPSDLKVGVVTLAFFGPCAALFAYNIYRKRRFSREGPLSVKIVGGVPIKPSRLQVFYLGGGFAIVGLLLVIFGRSYGPIFWGIAWLIAVVGSLVLIALASGRLPIGYIQFDPPGITIARRNWSYLVPWEAIEAISAGYFHDNPAVYIWLHDLRLVEVSPADSRAKALKHLATNAGWVGAPIMLMPSQFGMDLPLLVQAIERYVRDASARLELSQKHISDR